MCVDEQASVEGCPDDGGMQFFHEVRAAMILHTLRLHADCGMDYMNGSGYVSYYFGLCGTWPVPNSQDFYIHSMFE